MKKLVLFFLLFLRFAVADETQSLEKINSFILIEDYASALEEVKSEMKKKSQSSITFKLKYIECLALNNDEIAAMQELKKLTSEGFELQDFDVIESICWALLKKASRSDQYMTRLTALIGVHVTHDVRAINIITRLMKDSNAVIRSVAIQFASSYLDKPLVDEISKLFIDEKLWMVRLEVIRAVGKMKIENKKYHLQEILASDKASFEEKEIAAEALVNICNNITIDEISALAKSNKAGLRKFACDLSSYFEVEEAKDIIISLMQDPITDVRMSALNAIGLNYLNSIEEKKLKDILSKAVKDSNPLVSVTASYCATIQNYSFGETAFKKFIYSSDIENARYAAAALSKIPNKCLRLKNQILNNHFDEYVRANIALGLIAERKNLKDASKQLFSFLKNNKNKIMWEERKNPLFQILSPSEIKHTDQIPRYPEAVDQMTRLHILSILAIIESEKACGAIKNFLKEKGWGITGFASATLLKEGDASSLDVIRELLKDPENDVKVQAALVLALLGKEENVIDILEEAYVIAEYNMKVQLLEAIGHIASKKSINFLINKLDEPYQNLRVIAASSLINCINN